MWWQHEISKLGRCLRENLRTSALQWGLIFCCVFPGRVTASEIDNWLKALDFSPAEIQSVRSGEFVEGRLPSATARELAVKIAAVLPVKPSGLRTAFHDGLALVENPKVIAFGPLSSPVRASDLADFDLPRKALDSWRLAKPGESINLSPAEFKALHSALDASPTKSTQAERIQDFVKGLLLQRTLQYQISGLKGMASYERGPSEETRPGQELLLATQAERATKLLSDDDYALLADYPDRIPEQFEERFFWAIEDGPDGAITNLTHRFSIPHESGFVSVQRQFYVTAGYNVEQGVSLVVPFGKGSLLIYSNRTSSDQVEGFGGALRRRVGDRLMESELEANIRRIVKHLTAKRIPPNNEGS